MCDSFVFVGSATARSAVLREQFRPAGALRSSNQQEAETLAPVNAFRRACQPDGPAAAAPEAANYNAEELRPAAEGR